MTWPFHRVILQFNVHVHLYVVFFSFPWCMAWSFILFVTLTFNVLHWLIENIPCMSSNNSTDFISECMLHYFTSVLIFLNPFLTFLLTFINSNWLVCFVYFQTVFLTGVGVSMTLLQSYLQTDTAWCLEFWCAYSPWRKYLL